MAETSSLKTIKDQYFFLDQNFNTLFAACKTDAQRDQLRRDYVNARDNFWEARNRTFLENDPLVKEVRTQLKAAQTHLEQSLKNLKDIAAVLNTIGAAVGLAGRLITLASAI